MTVPPRLHAPSAVRDLLDRHGLRPDREYGQNFLVDAHALAAVVSASEVSSTDTVLEVGPGLGVLTRELVARAGRVVAVELDERLLPALQETVGSASNLELVHGDALRLDLGLLPLGSLLVANLPYNVATPLLMRALESGRFRRLVAMVQKEVAERLEAGPGEAQHGALSLFVEHFADVRLVRTVPPSSFYPPPEVTSAVVRLDVRPGVAADPQLFSLIRAAFRHRRKTLKKNLVMAGHAPGAVEAALRDGGVDSRVRAEMLSLEQFRELSLRLQRTT